MSAPPFGFRRNNGTHIDRHGNRIERASASTPSYRKWPSLVAAHRLRPGHARDDLYVGWQPPAATTFRCPSSVPAWDTTQNGLYISILHYWKTLWLTLPTEKSHRLWIKPSLHKSRYKTIYGIEECFGTDISVIWHLFIRCREGMKHGFYNDNRPYDLYSIYYWISKIFFARKDSLFLKIHGICWWFKSFSLLLYD